MSYTRERDQFIATATRAGLSINQATALLRYASTLQRLAVAQCNGDYPCDNGERKVIPCPKCESGYVPSAIKGSTYLARGIKACPDCRTAAAVQIVLSDIDVEHKRLVPVFGGDPRGAVLRLFTSDTSASDIDSGRERGIYVPARER